MPIPSRRWLVVRQPPGQHYLAADLSRHLWLPDVPGCSKPCPTGVLGIACVQSLTGRPYPGGAGQTNTRALLAGLGLLESTAVACPQGRSRTGRVSDARSLATS